METVEMFPHTDGIVEMFPHTGDIHNSVSGHVETVVFLGNKRVDGHIKIDVDVEKLDNAGGRATYAGNQGLCQREVRI